MVFDVSSHKNTYSAGELSGAEISEIVDTVGDDRLKNPPGDYFQLNLADETVEIPKQKQIGIKNGENIVVKKTTDYIQNLLTNND